MKNEFVTGSDLSRLAKVSRQAVSSALKEGRLYRDPVSGKYDLKNPVNQVFLEGAQQIDRLIKSDVPPAEIPADMQELFRKKLLAEVARTEGQGRKIALEIAVREGQLIFRRDVEIAFGAFVENIKNNFLQLGTRIGRGNIALRDRVEREVSRSIEKTVHNAVDRVRKTIKLELE